MNKEENWMKFANSGSIFDYLNYKKCSRDTYCNNIALENQVGDIAYGTNSESYRDRSIVSTYR